MEPSIAPSKADPRTLKQRARYRARRALDRIDKEPVRRARGLLKALRESPPDIIYFGDSMISIVGPDDVDRRRLDAMVRNAIEPQLSMRVVDGPSFHPDIFEAYLRLLEATPHRPLIVVPLCVRTRSVPLMDHPVHGKKKETERIRAIDPQRGAWRVRGSWPRPSQAEFDEFYRLPYSTILGDWTVGDYMGPIREFQRSQDAVNLVKMLYGYHHGGRLDASSPGMEAVTRMGHRIRELGCQAVVYQSAIPIETAVALHGQEMADRAQQSLGALNAAYRSGAGGDAAIIESGTVFAESEFIDPSDATEHLNDVGRRRLAEMIASGIRDALSKPKP